MARRRIDPVFAAIAAHREAFAEFEPEYRFLWIKSREAERRAVRKAYQAQTDTLISVEIQTREGLQAFADYIAELKAYGGGTSSPFAYAIEIWHLSEAMAAVSEALRRLHAPRRRASRAPSLPAAAASAVASIH